MKSITLSYKTPKVHSERWPVAVFAHNEGKRILACLDSIYMAASGHPIEILVLANGCTDQTEDLVKSYSSEHPEVNLISIELGDKSNAWDVFVHDIALDGDIHFFIDGDVRACPNSFVLLNDCLENDLYAYAASAFPVVGRSVRQWRSRIHENHGLPGCLYALRGAFVRRLREEGVRLPVGLIGDDSILPLLVKTDLDPRRELDLNRVRPCPAAGFTFKPLSYFDWADWKRYYVRRVRNSIRHYQNQMLIPRLRTHGIKSMPIKVSELYGQLDEQRFRLRWRGFDTLFFDWIALQKIEREIK